MKNEKVELKVVGTMSDELYQKYSNLHLFNKLEKNEMVLLCDYSSFDIPIGYIFTELRSPSHNTVSPVSIILKGVSQEFARSFDLIPKGHKTVCIFEFRTNKIPDLIHELPTINDWYESNEQLILS